MNFRGFCPSNDIFLENKKFLEKIKIFGEKLINFWKKMKIFAEKMKIFAEKIKKFRKSFGHMTEFNLTDHMTGHMTGSYDRYQL